MLNIQDLSSGIRMIGLDRADKRNAIGVELTLALEEVLLDTRYRDDIRALVFHGIGGHFCAGMDLKDFFDSSTRPPEELRRARAATEHWRCHLLRQMPQRIFTAVEGYCLGGALPILQCSHHVTAHVDARLGMPEINFGFVPGGQIVKSVGLMATHRALSYLALTGRLINAERARQWGLVGTVVEHNPLDHALQLAHDWVTNPAMPQ
ncbi:MAG: enoyl-CoA hydratase/isomerase family protein [Limnohabitans sp.]|jgi:trans-feruloyl-CoA hydratase/vanillin synthase